MVWRLLNFSRGLRRRLFPVICLARKPFLIDNIILSSPVRPNPYYWGVLRVKIRQITKTCLQRTVFYPSIMKNLLFFLIQMITRTATNSSTTIITIMIITMLLSLEFSPLTVVVNPEKCN